MTEEEIEEKKLHGVVKFYNRIRRFGFITEEESGIDYFFHYSDVVSGYPPKEGDRVEFQPDESPKGKCAQLVVVID